MKNTNQSVIKATIVLIFAIVASCLPMSAITPDIDEKSKTEPHWVTGTVLDEEGKPMAGVGVIIPATLQGVITDADGKYKIQAKPENELQFSFLGYKDYTVKVGDREV